MYFLCCANFILLLVSYVNSDTLGVNDTCQAEPWNEGPWGSLLEDWAVASHSNRQGRILAVPSSKGYYVSDRIDLVPPPPPPSHHHPPGPGYHPNSGYHSMGPAQYPSGSSNHYPPGPPGPQYPPRPYDEWEATPPPSPSAGKIVNRPPNPHKDKFKPSLPPPTPPAPPSPPHVAADRVDPGPSAHKQVSETDLYLLGAIEKLVYRVDLMEKRLRRMEESVHLMVAGTDAKPDPCSKNFTRVGDGCYHFSTEAGNWKTASLTCRKLKANLLELDTKDELNKIQSAILSNTQLKGSEWWTGGLNPGLLWIWAHSARPVPAGGNSSEPAVGGEGRCLALVPDSPLGQYVYRGHDCALTHRYVCEKEEDKTKLSNEIERVARMLKDVKSRKSKVMWNEHSEDTKALST